MHSCIADDTPASSTRTAREGPSPGTRCRRSCSSAALHPLKLVLQIAIHLLQSLQGIRIGIPHATPRRFQHPPQHVVHGLHGISPSAASISGMLRGSNGRLSMIHLSNSPICKAIYCPKSPPAKQLSLMPAGVQSLIMLGSSSSQTVLSMQGPYSRRQTWGLACCSLAAISESRA